MDVTGCVDWVKICQNITWQLWPKNSPNLTATGYVTLNFKKHEKMDIKAIIHGIAYIIS